MKYIASLLAILLPIASLICYGDNIKSFSTLVETDLNFMFVLLTTTTAYCFIQMKYWKIPGWILLLLTAFNTTQYSLIHNILGALFFISCAFAIITGTRTMRKWIYGYLVLTALSCWLGLFWMEMVLVYYLIVFHRKIWQSKK